MTQSLVSVLVPAYNREPYIEQCVDSALSQTWPAVEVIVVDDGSTDGTSERLRSLAKDSRVRLLTHPGGENRGQSASLNLALRHATGTYINMLDSDDFFGERKFEVEVPFMDAHPEIGLVYSNGYRTDADGNPVAPFHGADHEETNDPNRLLLDCYMNLPVNSLVRRDVMDDVGFFEETFRAAQDHDMLVRLAEKTRFAYLPDYLFYYRMHNDSISARGQETRWLNGFEILRRARKRYPYRWTTVRKRAAVLNYRLGRVYWRQGRPLNAIGRLAAAGALDPVRGFRVLTGAEPANP